MLEVFAVVALAALFVVAIVCMWRDTGTALDSRVTNWRGEVENASNDEETQEVDSVL